MSCKCAERRVAIRNVAEAIKRGDRVAVVDGARFVSRTMIEDAGAAARQGVAMARAALARGDRR